MTKQNFILTLNNLMNAQLKISVILHHFGGS